MEPLRLTDEEREAATLAIRDYFERERDEQLGELAAGLLLDFIAERLGPHFYNRGIEDAQALIARFGDSLDADLEAAKRFPE
jgi:uncharacterized protein (DUF2164 family)